MILGYNRRLSWVVVTLALWALFSVALAVGATGRGGPNPPPLHVRVGLPEGGQWIPGRLLSATEEDGVLTVVVGITRKPPTPVSSDRDDLVIEMVDLGTGPFGPPEINVAEENVRVRRDGFGVALAENYVLKFNSRDVQVIPRTDNLPLERFRRFLRESLQEEGEGRFDGRRDHGRDGFDGGPSPDGFEGGPPPEGFEDRPPHGGFEGDPPHHGDFPPPGEMPPGEDGLPPEGPPPEQDSAVTE